MTSAIHPAEAGLHRAFLREIIANPQSDADRLIFADWLDENGQPERAEFIRVQVELAKAPLGWGGDTLRYNEALRRRERELLPRIWEQYGLPDPLWSGWEVDGAVCCNERKSRGIGGVLRRGFVAEITCTLADWCGAECGRCNGHGWICILDLTGRSDCPTCHGTGRVNAHGPALVKATPLEEVRLTDKRPSRPGSRPEIVGWHLSPLRDFSAMAEDEIPPELFRLLPASGPGLFWATTGGVESANHSLSAAALAWAQPAPLASRSLTS